MRNNRTIGILLAVLLGLAAVIGGQQYLAGRSVETETYKQFWAGMTADKVNRLTLTKSDATLTLNKQGEHQWDVGRFPADAAKIDELLPHLINPSAVQLVSENPNSYERLGISSASAVLTVTDPAGTKNLSLGSSTTGGRYIQLGQAGAVYLVGDLPETVDSVQAADWIDKVITRIDQNSISQITVASASQSAVMKKNNTGWVNAADQPLDTTPFNPMLLTLESFATTGLVEASKAAELAQAPAFNVAIDRQNQNPVNLAFYRIGTDVGVAVEGQPGVYGITATDFKNFEITPATLKPKTQ